MLSRMLVGRVATASQPLLGRSLTTRAFQCAARCDFQQAAGSRAPMYLRTVRWQSNTATGPDKAEDKTSADAQQQEASCGEATEPKEELDEFALLQKELSELQEQYKAKRHAVLMSLADFENNKKRFTKERESRQRAATVNFAQRMVDVYVEFDAMADQEGRAMSEACQGFKDGIALTRDLYGTTLERFGAKKVQVEAGSPFIALQHENVGTESESNLASAAVAETVRPGWIIENKNGAPPVVLLKAKVKIAPGA